MKRAGKVTRGQQNQPWAVGFCGDLMEDDLCCNEACVRP
jgi:hypothetical protein